ncbi:hypothetical protein GCK72_019867 [Caenorhabditis remanei]|uniref:NADAR domain-containing protein n=1 Tax=Caenorhabditis remanei TaxID=31234 RepID=E3LJC7_CAERE|nr:hypothetical protein GCK72_019867 [Caenorhabditis remanei]EFO94809.1 hypothetical protein CRE_08681 [Caenorhabditis remanei]KAF1753311.1 hypothetical protein GCK72_019867 [Caenorhabditis remanei]
MPIRIVKNKTPKVVLFYTAFCPFSNFHPTEFSAKYQEKTLSFNCSEQYLMYRKAIIAEDPESADNILKMAKPLLMKRAGRKLKMSEEMLKEWSSKSGDVMFDGCLQKFSQNENLRLTLFRTHGMFLAEASARDKLWGIGLGVNDKRAEDRKQWKGANKLGKILEKVRDELWENEEFRRDRELIEKEDEEKRCESLEKS